MALKGGCAPREACARCVSTLFLYWLLRVCSPFFASCSFLFPFECTPLQPFVCTFLFFPFCFLFCTPLYALLLLSRNSQKRWPAATSCCKQKLPILSRQNGRVRRRHRFRFWSSFCPVFGRFCSCKGVDAKIGATLCQSVMWISRKTEISRHTLPSSVHLHLELSAILSAEGCTFNPASEHVGWTFPPP